MDKQSRNMFNEVMNSLSHMINIDEAHASEIIAEIDSIKKGRSVKKKEKAVEVVEEKENTSKSE